jgi:hypothetical protein
LSPPQRKSGIPNALSAPLTLLLTEAQTAAVSETIAQGRVHVATAVAVAALKSAQGPVRLKGMAPADVDRDAFPRHLAAAIALDGQVLLRELARLISASVDLRRGLKSYERPDPEPEAVLALVGALDPAAYAAAAREALDLSRYFQGAPKALVLAAIEEAAPTALAGARGLKKADLAAYAVEHVAPTSWLPPLIRHPGAPAPALPQAAE